MNKGEIASKSALPRQGYFIVVGGILETLIFVVEIPLAPLNPFGDAPMA